MPSPLRVDPGIFETFPGAVIGVVALRGVDNTGSAADLAPELREAEASVRERLAGATLIEHPRIAAWREAYRRFGAKPKKYPSSIEALVRRLLKGDELPSISPLVDLYNIVSLRHLLPVGGEDLDAVEGRLELRFAGDDEPEVELLGRPEPQAPLPGEVIYTDARGAVCRRWNWREAARTCLRAETRNAILVVEALPPAERGEAEAALAELEERVARLGGSREVFVHSM